MAGTVRGIKSWEGQKDDDGYKTYVVVHEVRAELADGPAEVMRTPGLPVPGALWAFHNDVDALASCRPAMKAERVLKDEKCTEWLVTQTFSTKPLDQRSCNQNNIDDPLLQPPKVSGSFIKYQEEATKDRHGAAILTSSHEMIRGALVEFDKNRMTVKIEQNVANLNLPLLSKMNDTVNSSTMWGVPRRCVKLSVGPWEKKYYGQCYVYYTRVLDFEIYMKEGPNGIESGFDKDLLDEGTKVLNGHWTPEVLWELDNINGSPPNPENPKHFIRFRDPSGEPCKVILNGAGLPAGTRQPGGNKFVAIADGITGVPISEDSWLKLTTLGEPAEFDLDATEYGLGNVVTFEGVTYVCISAITAVDLTPNNDPGSWRVLDNGLNDRGIYDDAETYQLGDVVVDAENASPGSNHVEKYLESNFFLLGIPAVL